MIKKGILGIFMLSFFLVPLSFANYSNTDSALDSIQTFSFSDFGVSKALAETPAPTNPQNSKDPQTKGEPWSFRAAGTATANAIFNVLGTVVLNMAASVTWLGGQLLETAIAQLVVGMGALINEGGLGNAINNMWKIIRDISNLAFIFGFIYIGISTIIDPDDSSKKRFLAKIIIGALLINFSLFFVKAIIDFANFTSVQIYNAMITGGGSLSYTITNLLGIKSLFQAPTAETFVRITSDGGGFWFYALASLFLVITGVVFAVAALTLIIRFVALVFIMIFSPILFAATVFPQTEKYASDLWSKLFSYSLQAPAYLLLTFITIKMVENSLIRTRIIEILGRLKQ